MKLKLLCIALVLLGSGTSAQAPDGSVELLNVDRALARDLLANRTSVEQYLDPMMVVVGNAHLREYFFARPIDPSSRLVLHPNEAKAISPHLAYTWGTYEYTYTFARCHCSASEQGTYVSIWEREKQAWKLAALAPSMEDEFGCGCSG